MTHIPLFLLAVPVLALLYLYRKLNSKIDHVDKRVDAIKYSEIFMLAECQQKTIVVMQKEIDDQNIVIFEKEFGPGSAKDAFKVRRTD